MPENAHPKEKGKEKEVEKEAKEEQGKVAVMANGGAKAGATTGIKGKGKEKDLETEVKGKQAAKEVKEVERDLREDALDAEGLTINLTARHIKPADSKSMNMNK